MNPSIAITIPVLNEEATLETQVRKILSFVNQNISDLGSVQIVLADNGSTDRTPEIARALADEIPSIQYIRLEQRGVGRALKASWGQSQAEIVGYMDLDLATDLAALRPVLQRLLAGKADIVTGSRLKKGACVVGRSLLRSFTSRCFNLILKIVFKNHFSDGMCGFKFLQKSCLGPIMNAGACNNGWFFATEILVVSEFLGYRVEEMPVHWTDDPSSKVKVIGLSFEYLKDIQALHTKLKHQAQKHDNIQ